MTRLQIALIRLKYDQGTPGDHILVWAVAAAVILGKLFWICLAVATGYLTLKWLGAFG